MHDFEFYSPENLGELYELLSMKEGQVIAGGTDLIPAMRLKVIQPSALFDLGPLSELRYIDLRQDRISIGALSTHTDLERSSLLAKHAPLLRQAAATVGSLQVRNRGTIGGNIATASPAADTVPPLLVLEAEVFLGSEKGERHLPLEEVLLEPGKTATAADEIITRVEFHPLPPGIGSAFLKLGKRHAMAISVVSVATVLRLANDHVQDVRIALGAVAPTVIRCREAERALLGEPLNEQTLIRASQAAANEISPISDIRATADYRCRAAQELLRRALLIAAQRCRGQ